MQLTVPFIPDDTYTSFLKKIPSCLAGVYFPLFSGPVLDARLRFLNASISGLLKGLQELSSTRAYCLLNTRFIHPDLYTDHQFIRTLIDDLETLADQANLTGIVFNDFYLLNTLSAAGADSLERLEAVPGVNCLIDSYDKMAAVFDLIDTSGFSLPGKIILDRSLNRDPNKLMQIRDTIKSEFPWIKIELLANEGCIWHCPFKLSHDAHIAFSNAGAGKDRTYRLNTDVGCRRHFHQAPESILKSPFIRPEDVRYYAESADSLKICGRTLGTRFLMTAISAYQNESFDGNLLALMDAAHWMSDVYHVNNKQLGKGFFKRITRCTRECKTCRICHNLFENAATRKSFTIKPFKDYL